jgi:UDP-3-O-[3-hydroxymyristoyl] glucosamine N-acyltransferase
MQGCVIIEDEVTIWGQVGTVELQYRRKSSYYGQTGVTKSVEGGKSYLEHQ